MSTMVPSLEGTRQLEGKRILVTGAAKRVGRSIAKYLAGRGARVLIHYGGSRKEAEAVAAECAWEGAPAPLLQANLESVPEIVAMFEQVRQLGGLDGLVNNAARFKRVDVLELTEDDWDFIHSVNLKAVFFCCQQAAKIMQQQESGGRIVNISSMGAVQAWADYAHYCASKAGVVHMTRALAKALAPKITVNSVAPGIIPFEEKDEAHIVAGVRMTPAARAGTGDDIAEAVAYFLGNRGFTTGQTLVVDGGITLV